MAPIYTVFKEIFDQIAKKFGHELFGILGTKTSQRLTLYLLSSHR